MISSFVQDLWYGAAALRRNRGYAAAAVLTLTVGVGVSGAAYSIADAVLFKPLPFPESDRLVLLHEATPRVPDMFFAYPNYLDLKAQSESFAVLGAFRPVSMNVNWPDGAERVSAVMTSADLFQALETLPLYGRFLASAEDRPGGNPVVILDHRFWSSRFHSDPAVIGQSIVIEDRSFLVVGVMPRSFRLPSVESDLWLSLGQWANEKELQDRGNHPDMLLIGRLGPGVSLGEARSELAGIAARLEQQYPQTNADHKIVAVGWRESVIAPVRRTLLIVLAAAALVLLISWVNIGNLMVAQALSRKSDLAARAALGASRWRLVRQMLAESTLIAFVGLAAGLAIAAVIVQAVTSIATAHLPRLDEAGVGLRVVLVVGAATVLFGEVLTLGPAFQAVRGDLAKELNRGETRAVAGRSQHWLRGALIVQQTALALAVLACAAVLVVSFLRLRRADLGFDPQGVMTAGLSFPTARYADSESRTRFARELVGRVQGLPGVSSAAVVHPLPLTGGGWRKSYAIEGQAEPVPGEHHVANFVVASPRYFDSLRITLRRGRRFEDRDGRAAPGVVVVDESLAALQWPDEDALGKRLKLNGSPSADLPWLTVVGVAGAVRSRGVESGPSPTIYAPFTQHYSPGLSVVARAARPEGLAAATLRNEIAAIDPTQPVSDVRTLSSYVVEGRSQSRLALLLMVCFAGATVSLAAVGTYSVMAERMKERRREIGIRIALGARPEQVTWMMIGQSARLWVPGLVIGLPLALVAAAPLSPTLYRTDARDPLVLASVTFGLAMLALLASYLPLRRILRKEPTSMLHE